MNPPAASASLYVGDLTADILERDLFELFSAVGPIYSIRVLRDSVSRRSLGYAYVNFSNVQDAERALDTLNYTMLKGRPIRIMWKQRDPSLRRSGVGNIFIKNLDKSVDSRTLHDTFSQFGNILSCKVSTDETTDSRGFGFVQYQTKEEAELAIKKVDGNLICGKAVFVAPFITASERNHDGKGPKFTNVYVKNFDESVSDAAVREAFAKYGKVTSAVVMRDETGKSRCFGFVNFEDADAANAAVQAMHGTAGLGGDKVLYCGPAQKKSRRQAELRKLWEQRRAERFAKYQGVNLYVKYLDDDIDDAKLREEFARFGTITSAKVMTDDKAKSKGFGFVCFSTPEEATRAVTEMNGKVIATKPLFVALHQNRQVRQAQIHAQQMQRQFGGIARFAAVPGVPAGPMPGFMYGGPAPQGGQRPMFMIPGMPQGRWMQQRPSMPGQPGIRGAAGRGGIRRAPQPGAPPAAIPGGPGAIPQPVIGGGAASRGVQYKGNVRNPQQGGAAGSSAAPAAPAKLDLASMLANASPEQQKQMLGERLYVLIAPLQGNRAGKITGMLLEGLDIHELLHLIEDASALQEKVNVAIEALKTAGEQN